MSKLLDNERKIRWLFYLPSALVFLAVGIYPFIYGVYLSLHSFRLGSEQVFVGLNNFIKILTSDPDALPAFAHTIYFVIGSVSIEIILGFLISLALTRGRYFETLFRSLLLIPMIMTPVAVGITWRFFFNSDYGMLNYLLGFFGIGKLPWVNSVNMAMPSLILVDIWQWTPFVILVFASAKSALPSEPFEAALVDGASYFQRIWHVMLPLLKPAILVVLLFRIVDSMKVFDIIYIITAGGPANVTETASMYAYRVAFRFTNFGYGMALSIVVLLLSLIASQFFVKIMRSKEDY